MAGSRPSADVADDQWHWQPAGLPGGWSLVQRLLKPGRRALVIVLGRFVGIGRGDTGMVPGGISRAGGGFAPPEAGIDDKLGRLKLFPCGKLFESIITTHNQ